MRTAIQFGLLGLLASLAGCATSGDGSGDPSAPTDNPSTDNPDDPNNPDDPSNPNNPTVTPTKAGAHLAAGVTITEFDVYQAVKAPVYPAPTSASKIPIIANRDALVRVFVNPGSNKNPLTATLHLKKSTGEVIADMKSGAATLTATSTDASLKSTFNFDVPAAKLPAGVTYELDVEDATADLVAPGTANTARVPADGNPVALGVQTASSTLRVVIVPVQYAADGSNRLPDTSATQLATYKSIMYSRYPVANVDISVHAPVKWSQTIGANGSGYGQILQAVVNLRQTDNVDDDVYYWGTFAPQSSFNAFCAGSCVTGLSGVVERVQDATGRASVGIGFTGEDSATTMAHEIGHAHGRNHAPCGGASGVDPSFPYSAGGIGTWGYDISKKSLIAPTVGKDMMGYCTPEWISDYTYKALFTRVSSVNQLMASSSGGSTTVSPAEASVYRFVNVDENGTLSLGDTTKISSRPMGEEHAVRIEHASGESVDAVGHFYKYDHLPGGFLLVPESSAIQKLTVHELLSRTAVEWKAPANFKAIDASIARLQPVR